MNDMQTVFSGTKDRGVKVERVFAGVVIERFIVGPSRECPRFAGGFEKQPEWKKLAISYLQQNPTFDPVFFHVGGRINDADNPEATTPIEPMGWYYWDETWAQYTGPFKSYNEANSDLIAYC